MTVGCIIHIAYVCVHVLLPFHLHFTALLSTASLYYFPAYLWDIAHDTRSTHMCTDPSCVCVCAKDIAALGRWLQPHPKAIRRAVSTCSFWPSVKRNWSNAMKKNHNWVLYESFLCYMSAGQCLISTDGRVSNVWELSPSQIMCQFPQEATGPRCSRPEPLDSKHDPSPLIFFLGRGEEKRHGG